MTGDDSAIAWAVSVVQRGLLSATPIRCNEMNAVFRLTFEHETLFLKIGPDLQRENDRLAWLSGRLPAPLPVAFASQGHLDALLMTAIEGDDLAHLTESLPSQIIVERLAQALHAIHRTDISAWPFGGEGSVLVHGDACLPNFLYSGETLSGYIDVGGMSLAEPEIDLAAAVWTLQRNLGSGHGLAFLHTYGLTDADEAEVERLRLLYR